MNGRSGSLVAAILAIAAVPTTAQWINYPTPGIPRTADGKPDLSAPAPKIADGRSCVRSFHRRSLPKNKASRSGHPVFARWPNSFRQG
jgi:hypothetical protein